MRKNIWNLENIKVAIEKFNMENGRYPTAKDFDSCNYLPWSRQMQRRFGGLVELRKILKLNCPTDYTKGKHGSDRARTITIRANMQEKEVYKLLVGMFGKPFVHREYLFDDSKRCRTDFYVHTRSGGFAVDSFYPKDRYSLIGCLNSKLGTYSTDLALDYPVIFLMLNKNIGMDIVEQVIGSKTNKLASYQKIMNMTLFKEYCGRQVPLTVCEHV